MGCPNVNLESWKELEASVGTERAYYLWDKYDGKVPQEEYSQDVSIDLIPEIQELNNFVLFEDKEKLCAGGICNFTAAKSTEMLEKAGLNPFPNPGNYNGANLPVTVKSPLGDFPIIHYVAASAINDSIYIYDMPQNEFISDEDFGMGNVSLKTAFKPRLIPLTIDSIKANYNLNSQDAAKFIRSVLNKRKSNINPTFRSYINDNITNSEEYIKSLEDQISSEGVMLDAGKEYRLKEESLKELQDKKREAKLSKPLTGKEENKVINFLRNKLKLKTREYLPTKTSEFTLSNIIKSVTGLHFDYSRENLDTALNEFKNYTESDQFLSDVWDRYSYAKSNLDNINQSLDRLFSFKRLLDGFFKLAKTEGIKNALSKYDSNQQHKLKTFLPRDILTKYASDKQAVFMLEKRYSNINVIIKSLNINFGKPLTEIMKDKMKLNAQFEKANTLLNYLKAVDFDASYIYESIANEAKRRYTYFSAKGQVYFQKEKQSTKESNEQIDSKIKDFLASIGVNIKVLDSITDRDGNKIDAIAKADMLNKIIQVVQGKADITTLSEEASHFFVEMLGENHPLYKEMFDKITGYKIYTATVNQYKDLKQYRNADGTINFTKLKKEAIAKLIMAHIIKQETGEEVSDKINTTKKWWAKVWDFIKKVFNVVSTNPFETSAQSVLAGDISQLDVTKQLADEEYLQAAAQASTISAEAKLLQDQIDIKLDDSVDPATGQKKHIYTKKGVAIVDDQGKSRSVNSVVVDDWYKQRFPTDNRSERQKLIDDLKANEGTKIHSDMEDIIKRYFNADGTRKAVVDTKKVITTNADVYSKLEKYFTDLLSQYSDPKTKFLSEVRVHDSKRNIAGTIDLVVILPDGSVDLYDWKSQEIGKAQDELKWFKAPAYRIQMEEYKKILQQEYGFSKFNKIRAIPIRATFVYTKGVNGLELKSLKEIEIGNADPRKIPVDKNYLLPVVMLYESTGDKNLDTLIEKLNGIYDILKDQKVKPAEKDIKSNELNELAKTIRDLQVRKDMNSFVENGIYELRKFDEMLKKNTITISNVQDAINTMKVYAEAQKYLKDQIKDINSQIVKTTDPDIKKYLSQLKDDFLEMQANAGYILDSLIERRDQLGDEYAKSEGINTLLDPQKSMDWLKRNFRSISTLDTPSMQTFYKVLRRAQTIREQNVKKMIDELEKINKDYKEWAATQGKLGTDMFSYLLQYDEKGNWNGDFLNIYNKDYFTEKNKAIKNSDFNWFKLNTTFDQAAYDKAHADQVEMLLERYPGTDDKTKAKRDKILLSWEEKYDAKYEFAYINKYNSFIKPIDKWHSDKYKFVYQKNGKGEFVNKPLKDAYEYFQSMIRHSSQLGMIDKFSSKFIPTMVPGLEFNPAKILDSIRVNSNSGFGNIDVLTGQRKKEIPVMMTRDIGVEKDGFTDYTGKSTDLFKVFGTWGVQMYNYEAMSDIEDISDMLLEIEKGRNSYAENQYGKINKQKQISTNSVNSKLLEDNINYYLYGQESGQNIDKAIKIKGKEYSAVKTAKKALKYMAMKTLGLNFLSGTATFVGGTGNAFFIASKRILFTEKEWIQGIKDYSSKDQVTVAAIYQLGLSLEDATNHKLRELSVDGAMTHLNSDSLMFIQRTGDKWATFPVASTMLNTHMIDENGKVISIRNYVKAKNNYDTFYNLPMDQQKSLREKMESEVEDLQKTKSLKATAKIVDGKLDIPGMTGNIENISVFKGIVTKTVKNIIGNATRDDINQVRMTLLGSVLMQFRTWMPQMITERGGDMSYDVDLETWNYGKARLFVKHLINKEALPLIGELITGFGTNTQERAKERYREFLVRLKEEGKINDDSEFMTEAEFIDMYVGNLRSMMRELMMVLGFVSLCFWAAGGPDDDEDKTGAKKWISKALTKYKNEFAFYYSPSEFMSMLKSPIPVMGLLSDTESLLTDTIGQGVGFTLNDDERMKKNHPLKYLLRMFPVTKELQSNYALINDEFRKDWDIK